MKTWEMVKEEIKNKSESTKIKMESLEDEINLINELVEIRKSNNITQKELATKINVPQSAISRFESQINSPRLDTLLAVANALDVEIGIIKPKVITINIPHYQSPKYNNPYFCGTNWLDYTKQLKQRGINEKIKFNV